MDEYEKKQTIFIIKFVSIVLLAAIVIIWGFLAVHSVSDVWAQRKAGEAELAKATANRQIAVQEAMAKEESAKYLAQAEIIRAEGVAKANKIIGDSLQNNESYLRYLWIDGLHSGKNEVIYIPTEANLPILEAGKR